MGINIAVFASGAGSNAEKIIEYTSPPAPPHPARAGDRGDLTAGKEETSPPAPLPAAERGDMTAGKENDGQAGAKDGGEAGVSLAKLGHIKVGLIVTNKPGAGVIDIAKKNNIPVLVIEKEQFFRGDAYVGALKEAGINAIVLAGFLWKVPHALVSAYNNRILNIHPALLPKYGGKGMYGHFVHEAVIAAGDTESGITIHVVDEQYDHGHHIFQAFCPVLPGDTPDTLAARIHQLEHANYPRVIEEFFGKVIGG